ncbi:DUF1638 domain-containing protein [Pelagibius sp. CAU 1746]|uniref:DUF1638 domain-containing protein n=1 Tax=Pelagibius sp. CAU 1746 TaxID=3140370 RepID=UPI00325B41FA
MTVLQPSPGSAATSPQERTLLIACGALAREIVTLIRVNAWRHLTVSCLPASWHNTPGKIPEGVRRRIRDARGRYDHILVLYGDCGTGGKLDEVLAEEGVERIQGPHCYSFYAGNETFDAMHEEEPAAFYLTDYLVRHFERLIIQGLGIDRHPELLELYFGNYKKLVYLAQTEDAGLVAQAKAAAERLGLDYDYRFTGYGGLGRFIDRRLDLEEIREMAEGEAPGAAGWLG